MMTERPNILLLMTDQRKATALRLYAASDVRTPLDAGNALISH